MNGKPAESAFPPRIGRYDIQRIIGRGMMGVVYQAQDSVLKRVLALKTISLAFAVTDKEKETFERRFLEEARAAATLTHPGIVVVYDFGTDTESNVLFMALEYLRGKTLEAILAEKLPLDWRESVKTAARIADALHHAHQHRVVHRDIKPANIMVLGSGEPKIMDFGVAKVDATQLSTSGQVFGSPSYMSPEQAQGEAVDARTDIFALGAVLYELLTGQKAFPGKDLPSLLMRLMYEDPTPVTRLVPSLPADLDLVIASALAKSREARYSTAKAFAEDLEEVRHGRRPRVAQRPQPKGPTTLVTKPVTAATPAPVAAPPKPAPTPATSDVGQATIQAGASLAAARLPMGKRVSVAILDGPQRGAVFIVEKPRVLIGRAGGGVDAQVELNDPEASRAHAVLEFYGSRVALRDLGSTNGTFIETRRVTEAQLEDHSEFRIGRTRLMLIVTDSD